MLKCDPYPLFSPNELLTSSTNCIKTNYSHSTALKLIIPIAQWPLKPTDENYWVFMLFACCEAILIGIMVLLGVLGAFWLVEWLRDKNNKPSA